MKRPDKFVAIDLVSRLCSATPDERFQLSQETGKTISALGAQTLLNFAQAVAKKTEDRIRHA